MPNQATEKVELFVRRDMPEGELHRFASGVAAVYSRSCPGKETANEDAAALISCDAAGGVLAVADGFGGQPAGDQASRLALTALADAVTEAVSNGAEMREGILNGFEQANQAVCGLGLGAATTLAVVEIEGRWVRTYHVGDSAVLIVGQRGKVKLQTVSHSPVGLAIEAGWLEETEAMHHEDRHLVSNMVGSTDMRIEIGSALQLRPRDTLLLASDGLFDNLHLQEIVQIVRRGPLDAAVRMLANECDGRMRTFRQGFPCKPDDVTSVVFRLQGPG